MSDLVQRAELFLLRLVCVAVAIVALWPLLRPVLALPVQPVAQAAPVAQSAPHGPQVTIRLPEDPTDDEARTFVDAYESGLLQNGFSEAPFDKCGRCLYGPADVASAISDSLAEAMEADEKAPSDSQVWFQI